MGILDRFLRPHASEKRSTVRAEFTAEELEDIEFTLKQFAAGVDAMTPGGMVADAPHQVRDALAAQGLTYYVERVMLRVQCAPDEEFPSLMQKAIQTQMKAYLVHNLPMYLYGAADLVELAGEADGAKDLFRQFLREQGTFRPDQIDATFLRGYSQQIGLDIAEAIGVAKSKVG